jgi:hypothetical protein
MRKARTSASMLGVVVLTVAACDSSKPDAAPKSDTPPPTAPAEPEPKATPEPKPLPPAPEGTTIIDGRYVHTCAEPASCPTLMQAEGAAHCAGLELGGLSWRLPTVDELQSWRGNAALTGYDVFHWSGTPWDEDPTQVWIYDPGSDAKTTTPPTRKPFTIRCVAEPR